MPMGEFPRRQKSVICTCSIYINVSTSLFIIYFKVFWYISKYFGLPSLIIIPLCPYSGAMREGSKMSCFLKLRRCHDPPELDFFSFEYWTPRVCSLGLLGLSHGRLQGKVHNPNTSICTVKPTAATVAV